MQAIRFDEAKHAEQVVEVWNRTARGRAVFDPLDPAKLRALVLARADFDPEGFLLVEDERGIAGGAVVTARAEGEKALLLGLFDRTGHLGAGARAALDAALSYLASAGKDRVATVALSHPRSDDMDALAFFWENRFLVPGVEDCLIDETVASAGAMLGRALEDFRVPDAVADRQAALEAKGYAFTFDVKRESVAAALDGCDMPFGKAFAGVIRNPCPEEHLMLVLGADGAPVGGALVSLPGGRNEWPTYGCACGLFGPTGVMRAHRGGLGTVLLFRTIERLRDLGCHYALVPTAPTIWPFYAKAGFRLDHVPLTLERVVGEVSVKIR